MQGVVRMYDPQSGEGVVMRDTDRAELVLAAGALDGSLFRMLRQGQRVNFELDADGRVTRVRIGSETDMGLPTAQLWSLSHSAASATRSSTPGSGGIWRPTSTITSWSTPFHANGTSYSSHTGNPRSRPRESAVPPCCQNIGTPTSSVTDATTSSSCSSVTEGPLPASAR